MILNKAIKILIVDDHPIIVEGYINILRGSKDIDFSIYVANNCDEAIVQLKSKPIKLVLLDLQLPASDEHKFISGEDIALWVRRQYSKVKILIITSITDSQRILNIIKSIHPEGFIIKTDMSSKDLITASKNILNGKHYFSETVKILKNKNFANIQFIDEIDIKILYHLSMGEKTKTIAALVHLSIRAVEDRKVKLKDVFCINKGSTTNLIKEAKKRNII